MNKRSSNKYLFLPFKQLWGMSFSEHFVGPFFWNIEKKHHMKLIQKHSGKTVDPLGAPKMDWHGHNWNTCLAAFPKEMPGSKRPFKQLKTWYFQTSQHNTSQKWDELLLVRYFFFLNTDANTENRHLTPKKRCWILNFSTVFSDDFWGVWIRQRHCVAKQHLNRPQDAIWHRNRPRNSENIEAYGRNISLQGPIHM